MQKENSGILYSVRNIARGRRVLISVYDDGRVVVSKSPRVSMANLEKIIQAKSIWIKEQLRKQALKPKKLFAHFSAKDFKENKERARKFVIERLQYFNQFYKFKIGKVFTRNQKSRWGSCSSKGNLNFNYKIVFLPPNLADYIVVHELCHLEEMNHGPNFWALVSRQVSEYQSKRKEIKMF